MVAIGELARVARRVVAEDHDPVHERAGVVAHRRRRDGEADARAVAPAGRVGHLDGLAGGERPPEPRDVVGIGVGRRREGTADTVAAKRRHVVAGQRDEGRVDPEDARVGVEKADPVAGVFGDEGELPRRGDARGGAPGIGGDGRRRRGRAMPVFLHLCSGGRGAYAGSGESLADTQYRQCHVTT